MTCETIEPELVAYCFATLDDTARAAVEGHLPGCAACVRAFVEVKRAIETAEAAPRPSDAARARLRRAVARELGDGAGVRRTWWERPLAFALAACLVLAASASTRALASRSGSPPLALSDRSR
jgi:anti-sigma factor RsiW